MMYESSDNSSFGSGKHYKNNKKRASRGNDTGLSPVRKMRKAPPTPPSPPSPDPDIPWGDRKPAAKQKPTDFVYEHSPDVISDIPVELGADSTPSSNGNKDNRIRVTASSTDEKISFFWIDTANAESQGSNGLENTKPIQQRNGDKVFDNPDNNDKMTNRELCFAAIAFVLIVMLTVAITVLVMNVQTRVGNLHSSSSTTQNNSPNETGDWNGMSPIAIPANGAGTTGPSYKMSVREEWELVRAAILNNGVTRILFDPDAKDHLPLDLFFYDRLVSGMVFSEEKREWVTAPPFRMDDDSVRMEAIQGMSMEGDFGVFGPPLGTMPMTTMTPNQKATTWLLYHDKLKDPNESVWRWAMASIYFKMGGKNWAFHDDETSENKWLTSAPLCDWERIYGSSGCEKRKQQQEPRLPLELDFDDANMVGPIAIEFALLMKPSIGDWFDKGGIPEDAVPASETMVRSITLSDNRLTGTIPGKTFQYLMPALGKLYLDNNRLTGSVPLELGGLGKLVFAMLLCIEILLVLVVVFDILCSLT